MVFNVRPLALAPEIQAIQQDVAYLQSNPSGLAAILVNQDLAINSTGSAFYLVNLESDIRIDLPSIPVDPDPAIRHLLAINTFNSGGLLTIDAQGKKINGVIRPIIIPPNRRLEMAWIGGDIGWVTDAIYTNAAIGMPVYGIDVRPGSPWEGGAAITVPNLHRITDGNLGTESDVVEMQGTLSSVSFYLDFGSVRTYTRMSITGRMWEAVRSEPEPIDVLLWSAPTIDGPFDDYVDRHYIPDGQTLYFTSERLTPAQGRYFGVTIWYVDRLPIRFALQELEIS